MRWLSGKSKNGETTHFVPNEVKRDNSDNPVTFASGIDVDNDSNSFAEEMKNDFNKSDGSTDQSEYETARMIMEEADNIGESSISDEDKMIDLYNIFQNYENVLSEKQRSILLEKVNGIDKMIRLKDKNNKVANNIQNKIQGLIYGGKESDKLTEQRKEYAKAGMDLDEMTKKKNQKEVEKESNSPNSVKSYSDDDWDQRSAMISAMAES